MRPRLERVSNKGQHILVSNVSAPSADSDSPGARRV